MFICFIFLRISLQGFSELDEIFIFVEPVVEHRKLIDDLGFHLL